MSEVKKSRFVRVTSSVLRPRLALAVLASGAAGCATPQEVAYTRELAKDYESQVFDLERQLAEKDAEIARLNDRFARARQASLNETGGDTVLRNRIDDLSRMIESIDGPVKDVERFELEGGYLFMVQDRILFDSGSADLGSEGVEALRTIAAEIAATPHGKIFVRGHTDSDPVKKPETLQRFPKGNLQLSAERAVSVAARLVESPGIPAGEVVVMGFGPHEPIGLDASADAKRLNRRVEIFVSDPGA